MMKELRDQIRKWKDIYKNVYQVSLGSNIYIYKKLNLGECEIIQRFLQNSDNVGAEKYILKFALLYPNPKDLKNSPAGELTTISNTILNDAGIFDEKSLTSLLNNSRKEVEEMFKDDIFQWKLGIITTFPGYTFGDLENMDPYSFFKLLRICEIIRNENLVQENPSKESEDNSPPSVSSNNTFLSSNDLRGVAAAESADKLRKEYYGR